MSTSFFDDIRVEMCVCVCEYRHSSSSSIPSRFRLCLYQRQKACHHVSDSHCLIIIIHLLLIITHQREGRHTHNCFLLFFDEAQIVCLSVCLSVCLPNFFTYVQCLYLYTGSQQQQHHQKKTSEEVVGFFSSFWPCDRKQGSIFIPVLIGINRKNKKKSLIVEGKIGKDTLVMH